MMAVNIPNYRCVVAPYFSFRDSAARPLISRILRQPSCHQRLLGNSGNSKARRANAAKARSRSSYCYPIRRFLSLHFSSLLHVHAQHSWHKRNLGSYSHFARTLYRLTQNSASQVCAPDGSAMPVILTAAFVAK